MFINTDNILTSTSRMMVSLLHTGKVQQVPARIYWLVNIIL